MDDAQRARLRALPKVDAVLGTAPVRALVELHGAVAVTRAVREALDVRRGAIRAGHVDDQPLTADEIEGALRRGQTSTLQPAINATGVLVHTNLGRAPLAESALAQAVLVGTGYATLEIDLDSGRRGHRHAHGHARLCALTGAEDALVVNNGAAAVLLALAALGEGRAAVVSRGELVEIGGGFRVPDVMRQSGCRVVEVGTTNRTHARDYERAVADHGDVALLLKVHRSNFDMVGFVSDVDVPTLRAIGAPRALPVVVDAGAGLLAPDAPVPGEGTVRALVDAGADVVIFSGDKLTGGPQAGIIVGRGALIERMRVHPLLRALRADKLALAALDETLQLTTDDVDAVPVLRMVREGHAARRARAEALRGLIAAATSAPAAPVALAVVDTEAPVGGGTPPSAVLPSAAVAVRGVDCARLMAALRRARPPIFARVEDDAVLLDAAALPDESLPFVATALAAALDEHREGP